MSEAGKKPPVICLLGPTAAGKTALAMELVDRADCEIISVDSAQVYRGMDIGTGKPEPKLLQRYPHRLIDIADPAEPYSASEFRSDALREIETVTRSGKLPLLVGGTMLYFKALRDGLADMPDADQSVRTQIEAMAAESGWQAVHARLSEVDPEAAARIHPNDPQRLQRALEVYMLTGESLSSHHQKEKNGSAEFAGIPFDLHFFAIQVHDRGVLHERIAVRFQQMLEQGLVDEVRALHSRPDLNESLPSIKSVGYKQVWQYLEGELDYDGMVERSIIATRQLAKRQLTWLRSWPDLRQLGESPADSVDSILNYVDSISI
ncbi:MAG: tRNA (adenosine(37)-N6)-dimethylallyltransferase MiaA [Gammaproteobacteria bacterium]